MSKHFPPIILLFLVINIWDLGMASYVDQLFFNVCTGLRPEAVHMKTIQSMDMDKVNMNFLSAVPAHAVAIAKDLEAIPGYAFSTPTWAASVMSSALPDTVVNASTLIVTEKIKKLSVLSGDAVIPSNATQAPVKITANNMSYAEKDRKVVFSGNVQAEHDNLQLWATMLSVYFAEKSNNLKGMSENIERIVADGWVKMKQGNSEGFCHTLTYFIKDAMLHMEGDSLLSDGLNTVSGDVIKFYIQDSRSEVLGSQNKRVEAVFRVPTGVKKP